MEIEMSYETDKMKGQQNPYTGGYVPPGVQNKDAFRGGQEQAQREDWLRRQAQEQADKAKKKW